jgi:hypothetical protein
LADLREQVVDKDLSIFGWVESFDRVQLRYKVDGYEHATVPAGTFKTFRVSNETTDLKDVLVEP